MRDLILKMSISIDGFVGGPDGGIKWVFDSDPEATAWTVDGKGLPVFSDLAMPRPLKLVSTKAFPAGLVAQIYRPT